MSRKHDGSLAFPSSEFDPEYQRTFATGGMTLRQYAAIKLKVPDSGTDWLDAMIEKSNRDYFAAKAMQTILDQKDAHDGREVDSCAWMAYRMADAMLKARQA